MEQLDDDVGWFLRDPSIDPTHQDVSAAAPVLPSATMRHHLTTTISNSNDHVTAKTKPAISTIPEEVAATPITRRRTSSISVGSLSGLNSLLPGLSSGLLSGPGILGKIKTKFHRPSSPGPSSPEPSPFKENYSMITRTYSNPSPATAKPSSDLDPKLDQYVRFYSQKPPRRHSSFSEGSLSEQPSPTPSTSKLSSFLRRKSTSKDLPLVSIATEFNRRSNEPLKTLYDHRLSSSEEVKPELTEFLGLKPLKRVAFHSLTFLIDPPQQIPSKVPRKGNVELLPNGTLRVNPLSEDDKKRIELSLRGQGGGIVVGGTGTLHYIKKQEEKEATEISADDVPVNEKASKFSIDKPIIVPQASASYTVPVEKMALDVMYTRCCHLREILPIPAVLKQIPKNLMAPLAVLQLRNPTPTMVEIETFADFIRIAPIICISLDGVNFSFEQFKILLSAMSAKKQLEKLSLRNTPIDARGWSLLCWFLLRNTVLSKLDITQCPSLTVNIFKKKKRSDPNDKTKKLEDEVVRMTCNKDNRSDVDWSLFVATIIARGGIEELILTGCCITDLAVFEKLIKRAIAIKTNRLGLAYNNLTPKHIEVVMNYWIFKLFVRGIDLGYNDFSSAQFLTVFLELKKSHDSKKEIAESNIGFISLNSTNLRFNGHFKRMFEELLIKLPNLKYLDLSNNHKLFHDPPNNPIDYFTSQFPLFPQLVRLHLENNSLSSTNLVLIANVLPFCQHLSYISLSGNVMDHASGAALVQAVKNSRKLITLEADFDELPTYFKDKLALYTMRNMETSIYRNETNDSELTIQLNKILELKSQDRLDLKSPLVTNFIQQAKQIKFELRGAINELNELQLKKQLTLEGKETLVRLIFVDSSIAKAMKMVDESFSSDEFDETKMYRFTEPQKDNQQLEEGKLAPLNVSVRPSPSVMSRTSSKTSLNQLEREEGSIHKFHNTLKDELSPEQLAMSGEEIRQRISNINLDQLGDAVTLVKQLKARGVNVSDVFKEILKKKQLDIEYITDELKKLSHSGTGSPDPGSPGPGGPSDKEESPVSPGSSGETKVPEGQEMSELYDQVLHKLEASSTRED